MQHNGIAERFALLTRQELAYLSGSLPQLTNTQKSKLNYKIKKKLEIFEKVELPLIIRAGFEPSSTSLSVENDKDCHSLDPGSKFGLEKEPNEHPGPGAYNNFFTISNSSSKNLQQNQTNRDSPPSQTRLYNIKRSQRNSASPLVENQGMNGGNDKNLLLLAAAAIKGSRIDEDCFKQYLLAQKKRN